MKKIGFLLISTVFLVSACETPRKRVVAQPIFDIRINKSSQDEIFVDETGISIKPISLEQSKTRSQLFAPIKYWNPAQPSKIGTENWSLVAMPAFEIQITNAGKNPISFNKASFRLLDDAGNSYQAVLKQDIIDSLNQRVNVINNNGWRVDASSANNSARALKLFDKNYESLPGIVEKRILAFDINNSNSEKNYRDMLMNAKYLRIVMFGIPVQHDDAGNIVKTAKFEYIFDVARKN